MCKAAAARPTGWQAVSATCTGGQQPSPFRPLHCCFSLLLRPLLPLLNFSLLPVCRLSCQPQTAQILLSNPDGLALIAPQAQTSKHDCRNVIQRRGMQHQRRGKQSRTGSWREQAEGYEMRGRVRLLCRSGALLSAACCLPHRCTIASYAIGKPPGPIAFHFHTCSSRSAMQGVGEPQMCKQLCTAQRPNISPTMHSMRIIVISKAGRTFTRPCSSPENTSCAAAEPAIARALFTCTG